MGRELPFTALFALLIIISEFYILFACSNDKAYEGCIILTVLYSFL